MLYNRIILTAIMGVFVLGNSYSFAQKTEDSFGNAGQETIEWEKMREEIQKKENISDETWLQYANNHKLLVAAGIVVGVLVGGIVIYYVVGSMGAGVAVGPAVAAIGPGHGVEITRHMVQNFLTQPTAIRTAITAAMSHLNRVDIASCGDATLNKIGRLATQLYGRQ